MAHAVFESAPATPPLPQLAKQRETAHTGLGSASIMLQLQNIDRQNRMNRAEDQWGGAQHR